MKQDRSVSVVQMKCLLIASESAEVLFHWTDLEFQQSIQEQYGASQEEGQGVRRKRISRRTICGFNSLFLTLVLSCLALNVQLPAFEDSISTLFAPIIISCSTMVDRLSDSYTSFTTESNHIYVLHQVASALQNRSCPLTMFWNACLYETDSCVLNFALPVIKAAWPKCGLLLQSGVMFVMWILYKGAKQSSYCCCTLWSCHTFSWFIHSNQQIFLNVGIIVMWLLAQLLWTWGKSWNYDKKKKNKVFINHFRALKVKSVKK